MNPQVSRRLFLGGAVAATLPLPALAVQAAYNFVRIDGLAEQAVGAELLTEIYRRAGHEISITPMPGKRALAEASSGRKDGETLRIFALGENEKRLIRVPTPISSLQTAAFIKAGSDVTIARREDLETYRTVIVSGVLHTHAITEGLSGVHEMPDPSNMFRFVQAGRADVALTSSLDGRANLAKEGITDVVLLDPPLKELELFHYLHESHAEMVPAIDAVIQEMAASGDLAAMRKAAEDAYIADAAG